MSAINLHVSFPQAQHPRSEQHRQSWRRRTTCPGTRRCHRWQPRVLRATSCGSWCARPAALALRPMTHRVHSRLNGAPKLPSCHSATAWGAQVYDYWMAKRKKRGKPLLRSLQAPTPSADQNPANCFRWGCAVAPCAGTPHPAECAKHHSWLAQEECRIVLRNSGRRTSSVPAQPCTAAAYTAIAPWKQCDIRPRASHWPPAGRGSGYTGRRRGGVRRTTRRRWTRCGRYRAT